MTTGLQSMLSDQPPLFAWDLRGIEFCPLKIYVVADPQHL